jgi:hypothetical protein
MWLILSLSFLYSYNIVVLHRLDYPGVGPEHSFLKDKGRAEYYSVTDQEALDGTGILLRFFVCSIFSLSRLYIFDLYYCFLILCKHKFPDIIGFLVIETQLNYNILALLLISFLTFMCSIQEIIAIRGHNSCFGDITCAGLFGEALPHSPGWNKGCS